MKDRTQNSLIGDLLSRRSFARLLAAAAAVGILPRSAEGQSDTPAPQATPAAEQLSPAGQAEAEVKIQSIFRKYGDRLTDQQRTEVRKSVTQGQQALEKMRAFPLENSDEPALALRVTTGEEL